jgi:hypothetical protein
MEPVESKKRIARQKKIGRRPEHGVDHRSGNIHYTFPDGYVCDCGHSGQRGGKLPDRLKTFVGSALFPAAMFVGDGYR